MSAVHIAFVLHRPARGGNVGAVARALTTMGFLDLRIVDGSIFDSVEARAWAHGSTEVLENAWFFDDLDGAIEDVDLVIGTSARRRSDRRDYVAPHDLSRALAERVNERTDGEYRVALVFGPEEHGLTNTELDRCQIVSAIPMRAAYPSLNLAQAVMVYAYELSSFAFSVQMRVERGADEESVRVLHRRVRTLLPRLGFQPGVAVTERMLERIGHAREIDVKLLHSIVNAIELRLGDKESADGTP